MRNSDELRNPRRDAKAIDLNARIDDRRRVETERFLEEVKRPPDSDQSLIDPNIAREMQDRWKDIQAAFIDQPQKAVEDANRVIENVVKHLSDAVATECSTAGRRVGPEGREMDGPASTEDLRLALQRCRAIFTRLISL